MMKHSHCLYWKKSNDLHYIITLVAFIITTLSTNIYGQSGAISNKLTGTIIGEIKDNSNFEVEYAKITVLSTGTVSYSDGEGNFTLKDIPTGLSTLSVSSLGYETKQVEVSVKANETSSVTIMIKESIITLDSISIDIKSEAEEIAESPIQVTVLEAEEVRDEPIGAIDLVKKSTGVLIRQQGALGSNASVQLNGLSGSSVRIYYDGIPIEYLGGTSLALNVIPINLIDRIEVYKGVVPVEVGTDALGGGINIVSRRIYGDFIESSYQIGSFNTHRLSLVGTKLLKNDIAIGAKVFYNSSDNDYIMKDIPNSKLKVIDNIFGRRDTVIVEEIEDVKRFHNKHRSYFLETNVNAYDKKWADRLSLNFIYVNVFDELQHGERVSRVPYGEAESSSSLLTSILNYQKQFGTHFDFSQVSNISYSSDFIDDSTDNIYNWQGEILPLTSQAGGEIGQATNRKGKNLGTSHRSILNYSYNEKQQFTVSNIFSYNQIFGKDPYATKIELNGELIDPNELKSPLTNNILGIQHKGRWLNDDKLNTLVFYKNYRFNVESFDVDYATAAENDLNGASPTIKVSNSFHGYGLGLKFDISKRIFARSSYEYAARLPAPTELLGNYIQIIPNLDLKAERSHNINLGVNYKNDQSKKVKYGLDLNLFYRDQEDLIRLLVTGNFGQYINEDNVTSQGVELTTSVSPSKRIKFKYNFTYQNIFISATDELSEQLLIGTRLPNQANLFFNTSVSYTIPDLLHKDKQLSFAWSYFYVNPFSITYVFDFDNANPDNIVSAQHEFGLGLVYKDPKNAFSASLRLNNVFNNELFDNFKVPKPGRNLSFKITYTLNKKSKSKND